MSNQPGKPVRVHPCQDTSETARNLVRAAAYRMEAATDDAVGRSSGFARRCADEHEANARGALTISTSESLGGEVDGVGPGGELILGRALMGSDKDAVRLVDTLRHPDRLAASAELKRLSLGERTGSLDLGVDAADTIKARNSLERMLAHQLGALHHSAMHMTELAMKWQAQGDPDRAQYNHRIQPQIANTEAARAFSAATRLMQTFHDGMLTLQKLRTGGRQVVRVIHQQVLVKDGGKAVVAGKLTTGKGRRRGKRAGGGKSK